MKKTFLAGLGLAAALCGCSKTEMDIITMDITGYKVKSEKWDASYNFSRLGYIAKLEVTIGNEAYRLDDEGLDGQVDRIWSWSTDHLISRRNLSEEQAKEFDEILAKYKRQFNIDKVHKEWEEKYKK